ncbi:MAG: GNAT family N-acetyltransferase [Myxococcales bacterium]|nr:GNAT family N-acetyltransferase [Myxococcales bacterium]
MSEIHLRPLDPDSDRELDHLCVFSMMTLWESRPEMRIDPSLLPDFGFEAHRTLYQAGARNPKHRYLIALDAEANIVGHSVVVIRHDRDETPYGYFWSRYVLPTARRQGLARRFLREAVTWFEEQGATFAEVHIHVENTPLRQLFESEGFTVVDKRTERWTYQVLRRDL